MSNQRITTLFAKKLAGEASPDELRELEDFLRANPGEQYFQEILCNWWESGIPVVKKGDETMEERFSRILGQTSTSYPEGAEAATFPLPVIRSRANRTWKLWLAAASIAGILFFAGHQLFRPGKGNAALQDNEIVAKPGTKSKLLLPDGTQVWLNSDSRIIYANSFNDSLREVVLEGEAYFDVVKDPRRPFIVHTSGISIRVLGTAFNVKSYPQDPTIEATLVRGLIEVEKNNQPGRSRIMLKPNEKLVYNKTQDKVLEAEEAGQAGTPVTAKTAPVKPESISISTLPKNIADSIRVETSWVYGKLVFEGDAFRELAQKMERWYNVKISFRDSKVAGYRFTGVFENENIGEALQALQLTASFRYSMNGTEVWIDKK
ncbi:MAG: DUF4974 domain-containing protein [Sphingobacteriales bacterium]|nr:DUF4974 domain-containing protein [Sphingobacteriales bacterium]